MNDQKNREETVFHAALLLPEEKREAYLALACREDGHLRRRIEKLLEAQTSFERFFLKEPVQIAMGAAVRGTVMDSSLSEGPGTIVGRYKLRERIGEGGCGVVYVADQEEPVRRRVALKVIKLGMDTESMIARFEAERQALAMMDHPNIAKVLDAGSTETGRPFFVMELVRGIKITDYCDQNNLTTLQRLDLFVKVCQAVKHAHQKGIIHRDLKPSNILVTLHDGVPVPKVIDFGIAKATEGRLSDLTIYTELHQFMGTPAYMSPEQAEMSGLDIYTLSDLSAPSNVGGPLRRRGSLPRFKNVILFVDRSWSSWTRILSPGSFSKSRRPLHEADRVDDYQVVQACNRFAWQPPVWKCWRSPSALA